MIAASPNWRSRSSRSARLPQCLASEAEMFVERTVLPVPPFGENTVTRRPWRPPPLACCLRPLWQAFRIAKTTLSVSCGSRMTSQTPVTKTRTLSRLVCSISLFVFIEGLLPAERAERLTAEAVAEHRLDAVEVVGTVGCVCDRPELEVPAGTRRRVGVREDPLELLGLAVGHRNQRVRRLSGAAGDLGPRRGGARGLEHLQVAQDDAAEHVVGSTCADRDRGDQVDVVVVLEGPGEELVLVSRNLERAQVPSQLAFDAGLGDRGEALSRDLLARERLLRGDEAFDLVRTRDRARYDAPPRHLRRGHHAHGVGAGGADRDVVLGDEHRHVVLAPLYVALVIRHVEAG